MNNWNYESLGFKSQKEMEESIARVKEARANPKNILQTEAENRAKYDAMNGQLDYNILEAGARLAKLDRIVSGKLDFEEREAQVNAEQEKFNSFMERIAKRIEDEDKAKADQEIAKLKAQKEKEIEAEIFNKYGIKNETETDKLYKSLLNELKGNQ
jgi:hypothetical protein